MLTTAALLSVLSGSIVGIVLGLVGGGGSILAVPLLIHVVGMQDTHLAIGTSSVAVAANAAFNLIGHARIGNVKWRCAIVFAVSGIVGAAAGAEIGKIVDGRHLLTAFGLMMIGIGGLMLIPRRGGSDPDVMLTRETYLRLLPRLVGIGLAVGALSGFFGIGGGFLIVPGLVEATAMPLINAIGSSLMSVTAFGATTAVSYAASGFVDWSVAGLFILGGAAGSIAGIALSRHLAARKRMLTILFSSVVMLVGAYVVATSLTR